VTRSSDKLTIILWSNPLDNVLDDE
jgi:hypothetical protein